MDSRIAVDVHAAGCAPAVCQEPPAGIFVTTAELEDTADRFLHADQAVVLAVGKARRDVLHRKDGRLVPLVADERV